MGVVVAKVMAKHNDIHFFLIMDFLLTQCYICYILIQEKSVETNLIT
ncbi:hypothetical protein CLOBOL_01362 [Enterocloster bolteae ATCC BAA-613]|uniref:Uncharacterized protein n=1 Tax=Enterocloster bolteae (strain ATCC BAA-613 / DSM 15670 / CCUG 46953 / JCM 12243 / WAL 16351) TaxID=411902 RepID=A8RKL9_ENTBW|nr:hypothetical protein CLOBOL_01362 [Enterocloster bolteae ATCC BAA-613]